MNVLYLCDEYPPCKHGGIGTVIQILAQELVRKGHNIIVCGFYPYFRKSSRFEVDNGVRVHRIFYGNYFLLKSSKHKYIGRIFNIRRQFDQYIDYLKELIKEENIDIVEIPDFNESFRYSGPMNLAFPEFSVPKVIRLHGTYSFLNRYSKVSLSNENIFRKEERLIKSAKYVIAVSDFVRNESIELYNPIADIEVINNGLLVSEDVLGDYNPKPGNILFAGTISEQKGIFALLDAWSDVLREFPEARLTIFGKSGKSTKRKLNQFLEANKVSNIFFQGFISRENLMKEYQKAVCAVFPSFVESFGMGVLEAMMKGCPVIYTKRSTGTELIDHGITGLLIDPEDKTELSAAIIQILKHPDEARAIGRRAAESIRKRFDISVLAEKSISFYIRVISQEKNL